MRLLISGSWVGAPRGATVAFLVFQYSLLPCALLQVTRQFSKEFNLFRSFRSQKSHTSSETKSRKLPGIKELDQPLTSASESTTTTETEDILTVAMESAATQTGSTESSRKSDPDLVLADNTPPADGDDCKSVCVCMYHHVYTCVCVYHHVYTCVCVYHHVYTCVCVYHHGYVCVAYFCTWAHKYESYTMTPHNRPTVTHGKLNTLFIGTVLGIM